MGQVQRTYLKIQSQSDQVAAGQQTQEGCVSVIIHNGLLRRWVLGNHAHLTWGALRGATLGLRFLFLSLLCPGSSAWAVAGGVAVWLPEVESCPHFLTLTLVSPRLWAFVSLIMKGNNTNNTYIIGSLLSMVL